MNPIPRREFLRRSHQTGLALAAGLTVLSDARSVRAAPANEKLRLAVIGLRSRGATLAASLAERPDCRVEYLCDVDSTLLASRARSVAEVQGGKPPKTVQDFRKALDDKSIDAVVIATPDHWHCLAAIWACRAGKDVYVETPLSHNIFEGRALVEAAEKHRRIVQVGSAVRSAAYAQSAKTYLSEGKLGAIHACRVVNQKGQANFPAKADSAPPKGLDWDMWNGPAPKAAYNVNYQNNWHGWWRYSGGDLAVDGIHALDLARWLCGLEHPLSVCSDGGRLDGPGANETPDTMTTVYDFGKLVMTLELSLYTPYMLKISPAVRNGDLFPYWPQCGTRLEIYGSEAVMMIGPQGGGWQVFSRPRREQATLVDQAYGRPGEPDHLANFVESIRSRKAPRADAIEGHRSALLVHYANISLRSGGQKLRIDPNTDEVLDNPGAMELFRRTYREPWVIEKG